jgi:hypothetical protein
MPTSCERTPESLAAAYVWWREPADTLREPAVVLRQILRMGTADDYQAACRIWGEDALRQALVTAPPGALDERSWVFWHRIYRIEPGAFPVRRFS